MQLMTVFFLSNCTFGTMILAISKTIHSYQLALKKWTDLHLKVHSSHIRQHYQYLSVKFHVNMTSQMVHMWDQLQLARPGTTQHIIRCIVFTVNLFDCNVNETEIGAQTDTCTSWYCKREWNYDQSRIDDFIELNNRSIDKLFYQWIFRAEHLQTHRLCVACLLYSKNVIIQRAAHSICQIFIVLLTDS